MEIPLEKATQLIKFARTNIEHYLEHHKRLEVPSEIREKFADNSGAFVTLNTFQAHGNPLRGCIGYTLPYYPLWETVSKVSLAAAFDDPRFPPVTAKEIDNIIVEISVLTVPEQLVVQKPEDYINQIIIGRDGLIVSQGSRSGLLLPQVPVEQGRNWDAETFLQHTCQKAWLPSDAWRDLKKTKIERFTAHIFEEVAPHGEVKEKRIGE